MCTICKALTVQAVSGVFISGRLVDKQQILMTIKETDKWNLSSILSENSSENIVWCAWLLGYWDEKSIFKEAPTLHLFWGTCVLFLTSMPTNHVI